MRRFPEILQVFLFSLLCLVSPLSLAKLNPLAKQQLQDIQRTLESLHIPLKKAQDYQDKTARVQFCYTCLQQDINRISQGLEAALAQDNQLPRHVEPVAGDYVNLNGSALHENVPHDE